MDLTCLGNGDAWSRSSFHSSFLLDGSVLLDCPPDILSSMNNIGGETSSLETIFLSHFHADHYFGLPFLFIDFMRFGREKDLTIVGPEGLENEVEELLETGYKDVYRNANRKFDINYREVESGKEYDIGGTQFKTYTMSHGSDYLECIGYVLERDGKKIGYTGDTGYTSELESLVKNSEVLISECSFPKKDLKNHLNLSKVRRLEGNFFTGEKFFLTHLSKITEEMKSSDLFTVSKPGRKYNL